MKDFLGVRWSSQHKRWKAGVSYKGVRYEAGYHLEQREAVLARDKKIIALGLNVKLQILKKKV